MKNEMVVREYLGREIEFKVVDGQVYANANSMGTNKKLENWKVSANTKRYIEALKNNKSLKFRELIISKRGGKDTLDSGTWIHEKLVLSFARYISVDFELWCDEQISTLIRDGSVSLKQPTFNLPTNYVEALEQLLEKAKENEQLKLDNTHKTNLIDSMTQSYDGTYIRTVCHDYVNKMAFETEKHQSELYSNIYTLLGRTLKKDIDYSHKQFCRTEKEKAIENLKYNSDNNLKGEDRRTPFKIKDTKASISKIEYVCDVLGEGAKLLEVMAKVFEIGIDDIIKKYQIHVESALLVE